MLKNRYYKNFVFKISTAAVYNQLKSSPLKKSAKFAEFVYIQNLNMSALFHFPFFCLSLFVQAYSLIRFFKPYNSLKIDKAARVFSEMKKRELPILSDFLRFFESCGVLGYSFDESAGNG